MANLSQIEAVVESQEEAVVIEIYQPNGEPYLSLEGKPATISVVGSESKRYRDAEQSVNRTLVRGGRAALSPQQIRSRRIAKALAAVTDWYGWDDGKKDLECTPEHVKDVIRHEHILRQVEAGIEDHAGFSGAASDD